jgi:hypothetical protein
MRFVGLIETADNLGLAASGVHSAARIGPPLGRRAAGSGRGPHRVDLELYDISV